MFAYLFIIALLIASASAFAPSQTRYVASSLNMGGMVDELRFKKHYNRFTFKKLAAAIDASGLADELNTGDYTIFAPSDAGMDEYSENADLDALLADNDKLQAFLKYHVVKGKVTGEDLKTCGTVDTLAGSTAAAVYDEKAGRAYMNDECKVETTDIECDNGRFHVIDYPMRPKA